jgi:D-alanyl-D-alanine carboxypeptidase (penicillin-binding protein 5/6)
MALLAAFVVAAGVVRVLTESAPPLIIRTLLARQIRVPGQAPSLLWPAEGQAAVQVVGLGSLGSSGGTRPVPIASVAKVMTAFLTLRKAPLAAGQDGFLMTVTAADVAEEHQRAALGESILPVRAGETITERQALEALLLPSANNVAVMLATHDAGGIAGFTALMNATAKKLGMDSTTYTDPSGFDDSTVSTAVDQLRLARVAIHEQTFAAIVDERTAELPLVGEVSNYDGLVGRAGYVGVKTGSDRAAGGCLMFAKRVTVAGRRLTILGVVLGQREGSLIDAALSSADRLGDSAAGVLRLETMLPAGTAVLSASSADGRRTTAVTAAAITEVGWGGLTLPARVSTSSVRETVRAGEELARVRVSGIRTATVEAVARRALGTPGFGWRIRHIF